MAACILDDVALDEGNLVSCNEFNGLNSHLVVVSTDLCVSGFGVGAHSIYALLLPVV
jgi:hypothetical protein